MTATARTTRDLETDLLIIPVFEDDTLSDEPDLDRASGGEYTAARRRGEFSGTLYEQLFTSLGGGLVPDCAPRLPSNTSGALRP